MMWTCAKEYMTNLCRSFHKEASERWTGLSGVLSNQRLFSMPMFWKKECKMKKYGAKKSSKRAALTKKRCRAINNFLNYSLNEDIQSRLNLAHVLVSKSLLSPKQTMACLESGKFLLPSMTPDSPVKQISWKLGVQLYWQLQRRALSHLMWASRELFRPIATPAAPVLVEIHRTLRAKVSYVTQFALLADTLWLWATLPRLSYDSSHGSPKSPGL